MMLIRHHHHHHRLHHAIPVFFFLVLCFFSLTLVVNAIVWKRNQRFSSFLPFVRSYSSLKKKHTHKKNKIMPHPLGLRKRVVLRDSPWVVCLGFPSLKHIPKDETTSKEGSGGKEKYFFIKKNLFSILPSSPRKEDV